MAQLKRLGLEGVIAKIANSRYEAGLRSGSWVKVKCVNEQEFVIGGYTQPQGSRDFFGALLVGYYENGQLLFASKVGTGYTQATLRDLFNKFKIVAPPGLSFVNLRRNAAADSARASRRRKCGAAPGWNPNSPLKSDLQNGRVTAVCDIQSSSDCAMTGKQAKCARKSLNEFGRTSNEQSG
jgi:hypothetical protein